MRLFVAVNFSEEIKDALQKDMARFAEYAVDGNFSRRQNLHLTVVFIGETEAVDKVKAAMDCIDAKQFSLYINGFGRFRRTGGDIYWRGIKPNKELEKIYGQLTKALIDSGFAIDVRPFKPHLTLGRQVVVKDGFDRYDFEKTLPKLRADVNRISLMKSERINGRLTYTEIYGIDL